MECVDFFQVFIMYFRSLTSSSASSSSSSSAAVPDTDIPPLQEKYDVFISFRGEDTRLTFTSHLYEALCRKKIETYIDYRLVRGGEIAPALLEAIQRSAISVIIFSKNYASSTWCLDELVHILECKEKNGQLVLPIFYDISPSDVRKQHGSYALAFRELEKRFRDSIDKVHKWRAALTQAAKLAGFDHSDKTEPEASLVKKVVQDIWTKLNRESSSDLKGLFGIEGKIEQIESLLCLDSTGVCCVGIWGMGGIGKTTLADAVFHRQRQSFKFEVCCFLANVREKSEKTDGLHQLRNKLVGEILKEKDVNIDTPSISLDIQDRLRRTKALIVLDDVNALNQLEVLVGDYDQFGQGSRIIITARDKGVLEQKVDHDKIYKVEGLSSDKALQLFQSHAFRNKSSTTEYNDLSRKVVDSMNGLPLGLKVMGSLFLGCKSKQEWEDLLNKLKRFPSEQINKVLRVSYDGLEKNEKEIFLDIACFYKGYTRNYVKDLLDSCGFCGNAGIKVLIDRSLISSEIDGRTTISQHMLSLSGQWHVESEIDMQSGGWIEMHDLVQEMGRAIAREQRSRLFNAEDVYEVLKNNQRDGHVQAIFFDLSKIEKLHLELEHANFKKMNQLKVLHVSFSYYLPSIFTSPCQSRYLVSLDLPNSLRYLIWDRYPLKSLPSEFSTQHLVVLEMTSSKVGARLWTENQSPVNLKWINLGHSQHLTEVPNLSRSLKIEHINLNGCESLVEIPSYFQDLGKLTYLDLGHCKKLKTLPEMPCNLEFLNLSGTAIEELPSSVWSHEKIYHLGITYCKHLKSLPSNSCKLKIERINLYGCESLVEIPSYFKDLGKLTYLDLGHCKKLKTLPEMPCNLEFLNLSGTAIEELPSSVWSHEKISHLDITYCKHLKSLPSNSCKLKLSGSLSLKGCKSLCKFWELPMMGNLEMLDLSCCSNLQHFPEFSEVMECLQFLSLAGTLVKEVPPSIGNLVALRRLDLSYCKNLEVVPDYLFCLTSLQELNLSGTGIKSIPASIKQAAQLSRLHLGHCKSLESLPELPPLLHFLYAHGCTSLKTVSSSSTAITAFSRVLHEKYIFSNCPKLDENARSNIMADAQLRIMRMAIALSKFKEDKIEENIAQASSDDEYELDKEFVSVICWGYEIPKWFSHQSEGSSIKIELPPDWFSTDFLGFARSVVVVANTPYDIDYLMIGCEYNFKTSNGESHEVHLPFHRQYRECRYSDEVLVGWDYNVFEEVEEGARNPTAFYNRFTEVNVDFKVIVCPHLSPKIEKCGICLLYGKDAEMIKQRALYGQEA